MSAAAAGTSTQQSLLISADSHVMESADLWEKRLPSSLRGQAPRYSSDPKENKFQDHDGGNDPALRVKEMAVDGVSAEVLYPTRALDQFGIADAALQEACFQVYNEWLEQYCAVCPERLFGVACISLLRMDRALKEVERAQKAGARGLMIWQSAPPELSFAGNYYDPFWEAAQALELPVSLHILTGPPFVPGFTLQKRTPPQFLNFTVTLKLSLGMSSLVDIMASGTFDRFPRLKVIVVENEVSWMPFFISQLDKYTGEKYTKKLGFESLMKRRPSEYLGRNVFATFFNDPPAASLIERWGADSWMWSNDFPHPNSTWPNSREVIQRDIGALAPAVQAKLVRENVARVYGLPEIPPLAS